MVVVPSHNAGDILIYVRNYKAVNGGCDSRARSRCLWDFDARSVFHMGCSMYALCTCCICRKLPLSLKSAVSEIVSFSL